MSTRLKIVLGILVVFAFFMVARVGFFVTSNLSANISNNSSSQTQVDLSRQFEPLDSDGDGISDSQEALYKTNPNNPDTDGDGFLDGEEILTGHDPTVKNEGQFLIEFDNFNLTNSFAHKLLLGLKAGDLNPSLSDSETVFTGADIVALATLDEADLYLEAYANQNFTLIPTTDRNVEKYINSISHILDSHFTDYLDQLGLFIEGANMMGINDAHAAEAFKDTSSTYIAALVSLQDMRVPEALQDSHEQLLTTLSNLARGFEALASFEKDPLLAYVALDKISLNMEIIPRYLLNLGLTINEYNVQLPRNSEIFRTVRLLNNTEQ